MKPHKITTDLSEFKNHKLQIKNFASNFVDNLIEQNYKVMQIIRKENREMDEQESAFIRMNIRLIEIFKKMKRLSE